MTTPQLTDEQIDAVCAPGRAERWKGDGRQYDRDTARLIERAILAAVIAAHTAKVLEDVEPVGYIHPEDIKNIAVSDVEHCEIYSKPFRAVYLPLYPAHTVAALKSRADALAARVAELEKDAGRYRLLRRGQKWSVIDGIGTVLRAEELDAAIDSAMEKEKAK